MIPWLWPTIAIGAILTTYSLYWTIMLRWWPGIALGAVLTAYSMYWAVTMGSGVIRVIRRRLSRDPDPDPDPPDPSSAPFISVIIPARDEENVVRRTVRALDELRYPRDRMEVIFAEDGSSDGTLEVLQSLASTRDWMRVRHLEGAGSKAAAVNRVLREARGDLIYVLDADSIPEPDSLSKIAGLYASGVRAMAGRYAVANAGESTVSRMVLLEEIAWRFMCEGRSRLSLPCPPPAGSNYAVDRRLLLEVGGLREGALAEDAMLASSLVAAGVRPAYSGVVAMVSAPTTLRALFRQRIRWYRGYLEALASSVRSIRSSRDRRGMIDLAMLFSSPVFAMLGLVNIAINAWIIPWTAALLIGMGVATLALWAYLRYVEGYRGRNDRAALLMVPYGLLMSAISTVSVIMHALRARKVWYRDRHSPHVDEGRSIGELI
ncbi:glycosyltransferase [Conexivisphaera calida]|uniref:Glycosyl transferase, group 2 family protein n=1 Tax=Conexivisphaera calida TaxID=1874277 RepID=A0A4P2VL91_9ARCH|nr:glycosyltransferase family 2 protein [Conexivisphaera calida]BBE41945.1 glycosyl transferase, group 2 family protein [Conexivisphaera calida]